jgi:hypothetical protein
MTKISCKVQENFLGRYFVKNFLAAMLLVLPDIFQHCRRGPQTPSDNPRNTLLFKTK